MRAYASGQFKYGFAGRAFFIYVALIVTALLVKLPFAFDKVYLCDKPDVLTAAFFGIS